MIKKHSGLRAALATLVAGLVCTSCSVIATSTKPAVQPAPSVAGSPAASLSAAPAKPSAAHRQRVRQRLVAGLNGYCRAWYVAQKTANVRYPTSADDHQQSLLMASDSRRLVGRLGALRAPTSQAATDLRGFTRNERGLVRAFVEEASSDPGEVSAGDAAYDQALADRHGYATDLGAHECDGLLPRSQARAAVAATRRWYVTADPHASCVSLVTSEFSLVTWGENSSPMETCLLEFHMRRQAVQGVPRAIRVQNVTGVENLQATVTFDAVPDCGCGNLVAKLYFEHARWLLDDVYKQ